MDGEEAPAARPRTPVIVVSLDTCRADRLAPYGGAAEVSPALAQLAAESVVFTDCLAQSTSTGPSHRSLFTGQFVHRHGLGAGGSMHSPYTLAGLLRSAGYETAGFVGGGMLGAAFGFADGFDTYRDRDPGAGARSRGLRSVLPEAGEWCAAHSSGPFFLFVHTYDIHCPYWPDEPWRGRFAGGYSGKLDLAAMCGIQAFAPLFRDGRELPEEDRQYLLRMYDGDIAMADELLGRFLDRLRADGTLDRALLVVLSDHGESLGEHRHVGHERMWEEQLRVPLLIRFPDRWLAGTRCDEPVMLVDMLPTVLDFLGLPVPPGVQGESLLPLLRDEGSRRRSGERMRISQNGDLVSARFDDRWKLVVTRRRDGTLEPELYDLRSDPSESVNLALTPEGRARFDELHGRYLEFRRRTAEEDQRLRGTATGEPTDPDLAHQLAELGYGGGG